MCLLAVGVSAQFTRTGIIHRDGTMTVFTPEEAANVVAIGASGVTMKDGNHFQYTLEMAANHNGLPLPLHSTDSVFRERRNVQHRLNKRGAVIGSGGVITPGGRLIQLPHGVHVILAGSSAALLSNGDHIQYKL